MEVVSGTESRANAGVTVTAGETGELGGLTKVIGASVDPHPRGSLFDDDISDHGDVASSFLDSQGDSKGEENGSSDFSASQQVMIWGLHPSRVEPLADVPFRLALAAYNHHREHRA